MQNIEIARIKALRIGNHRLGLRLTALLEQGDTLAKRGCKRLTFLRRFYHVQAKSYGTRFTIKAPGSPRTSRILLPSAPLRIDA